MNKHENDHLAELKDIDGDFLDELAESYPMLGRSAKKRILEKCLEKTDESEFRDGITVTGTEIYKRPVWSRVMGAAAAFVLGGAAITGAVLLNAGKNEFVTDPSSDKTSECPVTTTVEKTEKTTSFSSTTETATTTTSAVMINVETSDFIIYTTAYPFAESTTTSETTETTETTTTDVTTTTDTDEQPTTETESYMDAEEISGSWSASGREKNRVFVFSDSTGGRLDLGETSLAFTYSISGDVISFHFAEDESEPETGIIERLNDDSFEIRWLDGTSEILTRIG